MKKAKMKDFFFFFSCVQMIFFSINFVDLFDRNFQSVNKIFVLFIQFIRIMSCLIKMTQRKHNNELRNTQYKKENILLKNVSPENKRND